MITMELIPLKSIGPFLFNSELSHYTSLALTELPEEYDKEVGWRSYALPDNDVRIYVENGTIVSIACYDECIFCNYDLVGLHEEVSKSIIQSKLTHLEIMELDDEVKVILEYDDIGMQVYIKDGVVESVTCNGGGKIMYDS